MNYSIYFFCKKKGVFTYLIVYGIKRTFNITPVHLVMKQHWTAAEFIDHWTLAAEEINLINRISKTAGNRLGCAILLKHFQNEGKFLQRKQDIPNAVIEHIAQQLHVSEKEFELYELSKLAAKRHRRQIRAFLEVRTGTVEDAKNILTWLFTHDQLLEEHNFDRLKESVYERYKELKIEPPQPGRVERLVRSSIHSADERLYKRILAKLTPEAQAKLEELLRDNAASEKTSLLSSLKSEAGAPTMENVLTEVGKLERLRSLALPPDLFAGISRKRLLWCKRRIAVEDLSEIRRHPLQVRYSLLAAFCIVRSEEITDTLVELLINVIHKMGSRAKHIVDKEVIKEIKRVQGKNKLLYEVASASLQKPDGTVKEVIYPIAGEQTLRDLVTEYKQGGLYEQRIQTIMRGSYSNHYRRMVPHILRFLSFCATNETSKPIIEALALMKKYADKNTAFYPEDENIPIEGVVKPDQLELVQQGQKINRINYELVGLPVLREKLKCKEVYVQGASRYRNPDEDLPTDFDSKRNEYYAELQKPLSADEFIATQKQELKKSLTMLDREMPKNKKVEVTRKQGKPWIKVTPVDPQPEPKNLASLKAEVGRRWSQIYLLDMLKEADLRIGFTNLG